MSKKKNHNAKVSCHGERLFVQRIAPERAADGGAPQLSRKNAPGLKLLKYGGGREDEEPP